MEKLGIKVNIKNVPPLDNGFIPLYAFNKAYLSNARKPIAIAVERADGQTATTKTFIYGTPDMEKTDCYYLDRLVKTLLWMKGGYRVYVDNDLAYNYLSKAFSKSGSRSFDYEFMSDVYEHPFEVILADKVPKSKDSAKAMGGRFNGCRIGFDAGGSDRKVSAVMDGETVYSEEVVWHPKLSSDPSYHYDGIVAALKSAAAHLPRVDGVGVSSAGVYVNNRTMKASLFIKVNEEDFESKVKDIYIRAITDTFGNVPFAVINDGDVSALAGAMTIGDGSVLGIAMGTSEAGGFVDNKGRVTGWLNELAFVPVDASENAEMDEWSGDIGCGVKYFSQDAVIKLAPRAGITLDEKASPAEKLKFVQELIEKDDGAAKAVFETIGVYLGHTLAFYYDLYACKHVLLLGRVMSGKGGDIILDTAKKILDSEYPELNGKIFPSLPDEKFRRVGQSMAAAGLPEIK